jgi:membrane protease YdiL (CAAX protease family)
MTAVEQLAGVCFFVIYLLVLPFVTSPAFELVEKLLNTDISSALQHTIYYYAVFAVTVIIFHNYIGKATVRLTEHVGEVCRTAVVGLVALYGLNELVFRLTNLIMNNRTNLNDTTISAQINDAPRVTFLIVVLLAPFVEEVLFRGLVFGGLKGKNRVMAYVVSCVLFAALHVWQFAVVQRDITYFLLMVQYLVPGLVLAWAYDHSGTIWTPFAVHAAANALSIWVRS